MPLVDVLDDWKANKLVGGGGVLWADVIVDVWEGFCPWKIPANKLELAWFWLAVRKILVGFEVCCPWGRLNTLELDVFWSPKTLDNWEAFRPWRRLNILGLDVCWSTEPKILDDWEDFCPWGWPKILELDWFWSARLKILVALESCWLSLEWQSLIWGRPNIPALNESWILKLEFWKLLVPCKLALKSANFLSSWVVKSPNNFEVFWLTALDSNLNGEILSKMALFLNFQINYFIRAKFVKK